MSSFLSEDVAEETEKYVQLTRIFFCKVIECVYCSRCPKELSDLTEDEDHWFSLDIPKSQSLRQLLSRRTEYGWFQIDVILTDPDVVIERWILSHEPSDVSTSRPIFSTNRRELRRHVFCRFSQLMRSIYSMLNALPAKTLEFALSQVTAANRRITAVCSHFMSLPVRDVRGEGQFVTEFGPVTTPLGRCAITCHSLSDVLALVPKINVTDSVSAEDSGLDTSSWVQAPGRPEGESGSLPSELLKQSFVEDLPVVSEEDRIASSIENSKSATPAEFLSKLEEQKLRYEDSRTVEDMKRTFSLVSREVDALQEDWLSTSG